MVSSRVLAWVVAIVICVLAPRLALGQPEVRAAVLGRVGEDMTLLGCSAEGRFIEPGACPSRVDAQVVQPVKEGGAIQATSKHAVLGKPGDGGPCSDVRLDGAGSVVRLELGRSVTVLSNSQPTYLKVIGTALRVKNFRLEQLLRVDLEGDGVDEVVFAGKFDGPVSDHHRKFLAGLGLKVPSSTDHSVAGVRKVVGDGEVATIEFGRGEILPTAMGKRLQIEGVVDLDGDGALEIVTSERLDHSMGFAVHRLVGNRSAPVTTAGCGW